MAEIEKVEFGEVTIGGKIYYSDIISWWDDKFEEIEKIHYFDEKMFYHLLEREPEVMIIASGINDKIIVEQGIEELAEEKNVMFFEHGIKKALSIFHSFLKEGRKAVIVIHNM